MAASKWPLSHNLLAEGTEKESCALGISKGCLQACLHAAERFYRRLGLHVDRDNVKIRVHPTPGRRTNHPPGEMGKMIITTQQNI